MRLRVGIALLAVGIALGAGGAFAALTFAPGSIGIELANARQSLDESIRRSAELEHRLGDVADLARGSAATVDRTIIEAGRIEDRGKRIVLLVGAIRIVAGDLKRIAEGAGD